MSRSFITLIALLTTVTVTSAEPLAPSFTYQGELLVSGVPANGEYDFQFELFDAPNGEAISNEPVEIDNAPVVDGVFSTELDFGPAPFAGDQLWLEIGVREGASVGGYTGLLPLQKLTATPYALHAEMVAMDAIGATEIADNSVTAADLAPAAVDASILADNAVDTAAIQASAVTGDKLALASIQSVHLADNTVSADKVDSNEIQLRVDTTCPTNQWIAGISPSGAADCRPVGEDAITGFEAATDLIQRRVTGTCALGQAMVGIDESGSVQCAVIGNSAFAVRAAGNQIEVTAPVAGQVTVNSTVTVGSTVVGTFVSCSITTGSVLDTTHLQIWQSAGISASFAQLSGTRGFDLDAGSTGTYRLICSANDSFSLSQPTLTAIFTPAP